MWCCSACFQVYINVSYYAYSTIGFSILIFETLVHPVAIGNSSSLCWYKWHCVCYYTAIYFSLVFGTLKLFSNFLAVANNRTDRHSCKGLVLHNANACWAIGHDLLLCWLYCFPQALILVKCNRLCFHILSWCGQAFNVFWPDGCEMIGSSFLKFEFPPVYYWYYNNIYIPIVSIYVYL